MGGQWVAKHRRTLSGDHILLLSTTQIEEINIKLLIVLFLVFLIRLLLEDPVRIVQVDWIFGDIKIIKMQKGVK
jgi:hypothetical protein